MIKIRTMCNIYNMYIQLQLNKKQEIASDQKALVKDYLKELKKIKPFIEHYIDYNALLNGKVKELPENFSENITNFKMCNIVVRNYFTLYKLLTTYEAEVQVLKKQKVKYVVYKTIISSFNKAIIEDMIETGNGFDNIFFGHLSIYYTENHNKSIDWNRSLAKKQEIIDKGGEPYLRENYIKAKQNGIEYNGEKWLIKRDPRPLLSLRWKVAPRIIAELGREGANYKFFPARGNSGIISYFMNIYKQPTFNYDKFKIK